MIILTKPEPYCPVCGARMILRRPKPEQEWNPFWGCSQYPDCRGTRNIKEDGTPITDKEIETERMEWRGYRGAEIDYPWGDED